MFPFYQIEKWHSCVNCLGVVSLVFGLLFHHILMKIVNKRLPAVCYSYSDMCDGSKDFNSVVCDFRSSSPFFMDRKKV